MALPSCNAVVAPVDAPPRPSPNRVFLGDCEMPVAQDHLLEPFTGVLAAIDQLASLPAAVPESEKTLLGNLYAAFYRFFKALLPSARHEVLHDLTYSVSLFLVGEAIEANRGVLDSPRSVGS
jgi:hypothetical protein